ncbi:MAG: thioredoxin family protein [Thermodesulfobacteriota bacterium]
MGSVEFDDSLKSGVSLMDFSANWCAPCKAQEPIIKNLVDKFKNRASIIEVDIDNNRDLATKFMVQSIPTLIIFKDGKEIKRLVGLQTENTISKSLESAL